MYIEQQSTSVKIHCVQRCKTILLFPLIPILLLFVVCMVMSELYGQRLYMQELVLCAACICLVPWSTMSAADCLEQNYGN
jgi:hypothetical protein